MPKLSFLAHSTRIMALSVAAIAASLAAATAVDFRWTQGFWEGTIMSGVPSKDGTTVFQIYCASGQESTDAGIELFKKNDAGELFKGSDTLQVTIGDKTYQTEVESSRSVANTISEKNDLMGLVESLRSANTGYFTVGIPARNWEKTFSALGARAALAGGAPKARHSTILDGCLNP